MAGLLGKVARFAGSPQGRAAIGKAKTAANDPKNRAKIRLSCWFRGSIHAA